MEIKAYFEKLAKLYHSDFDMITPVQINGKTYLGYGYFYANSSRYVLVKRAKLWNAEAFEHIIFLEGKGNLSVEVEEAKNLIENHMEERYVRDGQAYPPKDHMYSFLTVIILTDEQLDAAIKNKVNGYKFTKNYLFTIRGYAEGRIIVINVKDEEILLSKAAKKLEELFKKIF
jgi:hypothetical protein